MSKIYVVTEGEYSDYHIEACFSTKGKAQEFIKTAKKTENFWYTPEIEEWDLDESTDIVDVIYIYFTFTSPLSKNEHKEEIECDVNKEIRCKARDYISFWGIDLEKLEIVRIANPNKDIEDEISKYTKVAYDTAKKIKYLYEVENVKTLEEIREIIE